MGDLENSTNPQPSLFDETENRIDETEDHSLYFVTNTRNLLSILGSGMIVPAQYQFRYRPDSRDGFSGAIPLWRNGLPSELEIDSDKDVTIIELNERDFLDSFEQGIAAQDQNVIAFNGPLPATLINTIRMHTEEAIADFLIRAPDDVVTERELFAQIKPYQLLEPSAALTVDELKDLSTDLNVLDRYGGALKALDYIGAKGDSAFSYAELLTKICMSRFGLAEAENTELTPIDDDLLIIEVLIDYLLNAHPEDRLDLDAIQRSFEEKSGEALTDTTRKWLRISRQVVDADREAPPLDDRGDVIKRGALLFFLRPDLERLKASKDSSLEPGASVLTVAAFFAGFFTGYTRLGGELKGKFSEHANYISLLLKSLYLNRGGKVETKTTVHHDGADNTLVINGVDAWSAAVQQLESLAVVLHKARILGFELEYDYEHHFLKYEKHFEPDKSQWVYVEPIQPLRDGESVVRFISPCMDLSGSKKRALTKSKAEELLLWNSRDDMYCSFAFSEKYQAIVAQTTQIVGTMDDDELKMMLNEVASIADRHNQNASKKK